MNIVLRDLALIACATLVVAPGLRAADLPDGEGKEIVQKSCTSCHGSGKATSENLTEAGWSIVVDKMMGMGATLTDAEFATVVKYLAKNFPEEKK